jgi:hypothetical protein
MSFWGWWVRMARASSVAKLPPLCGVVQRVVVYGVALLAQPVAEVAHRAQENRNPRLVAPHMGRLFGDFRHPHRVAGGVEALQRGGAAV